MNPTSLSLTRPITIAMVFVCMSLLGVIGSQKLPLESIPDIEFPAIFVFVPYRNSTPEDVERRITRPVEEALGTLPGVRKMESESRDDGTQVNVFFDWGADLAAKSVEARDKIDALRDDMPRDVDRIQIFKFSGADQPMLVLRISAERDLSNSYEMLERNLKRRIERIEGVSRVDLYGVQAQEVRVELSAERVAAFGVDLTSLSTSLQRANFSLTAGDLVEAGKRYYVKPEGRFDSLDAIRNVVIAPNGLRLGDVADVVYAKPDLLEARHLNRRQAIGLNVAKETGANLVAVSERVRDEIEAIKQLPEMRGISLIEFTDQAKEVKQSLADLINAGLIGALLSFVVLYLFLRNALMTLVVTLAVPLSLLITLAVMYFTGFTLNILTLMGLMLSVGMLVDNSVVVSESIFLQRAQSPGDVRGATLAGVKTVGLAVALGTLTSAIVFLPNIVGQQTQLTIFLSHIAVTICVSLAASLLVSVTLIPLLTTKIPVTPDQGSRAIDWLARHFANWLAWTLRHRGWTSLFILLTVFSVAIPAAVTKMDMFPDESSSRFEMDYNIDNVYALSKIEESVDHIEAFLYANKERFEIESVYSYYAQDQAQTVVYLLQDEDQRSKTGQQIKDEIREEMPEIAIGRPTFEEQRSGSSGALGVQVFGESSEGLHEVAENVTGILRGVPQLRDVRLDAGPESWEVRVKVDRERAHQNGLSSQQVAEVVAGAMRGTELRPYRSASGEVDMLLEFRRSDRTNLDALMLLPIITPDGNRIALSTVADLSIGDVPATIKRSDRRTAMTINFGTAEGVTADDARALVDNTLSKLSFPAGYSWGHGQAFDDEARDQQTMMVNMLLAIICIYLVMAALFESVLVPSAIITCILFSYVGVYWFFMFTGTSFSFMAMIGLLVLMGVVVNNGIVLVDYVNQLRAQGHSREDALIHGSRDRLRPILMTAGTTILGMVPLAVSDTAVGGDGPAYYPMARAVIGGLGFATIVSLFMLPTIYLNLEDLAHWGQRVLARARGQITFSAAPSAPTGPQEKP
ncbi:MAG: efflux RND transporter permease subunit [Gammaproteobacteria bacterium]|nr:efflux RND transporter permease subunit [Gammaproteobacteria bacterium]